MVKKTIRQLLDYNRAAGTWLIKNKDNQDTKLGYAIQRMAERYTKAIKPYTERINTTDEQIEDLRQDHQKEENGKLVWDMVKDGTKETRERAYSKADAKILTTKIREVQKKLEADLEVMLEQEVDIEPRFATSIPDNLTEFEKEVFTGLVIDPDMISKAAISLNGHAKEPATA